MFRFPPHLTMLVLAIALVSGLTKLRGQDEALSSQLIAIHNKWFKAFDNRDSDTMNMIETRNITIVLPNGYIARNFAPRTKAETQSQSDTKRTLSSVTVRQFGDSALLVGIVTTESPKEKSQSAETIAFVKVAGEWKIASAQWTDIPKAE